MGDVVKLGQMSLDEALRHAKDGAVIRRKGWDRGTFLAVAVFPALHVAYVFWLRDGILQNQHNMCERYMVTPEDEAAKDWDASEAAEVGPAPTVQ